MPAGAKAVVIGVSGCSSSGKTTLSRLLRDIFPNTFILHEDDFYRPEEELPKRDGLVDWDSPESLNISDIASSLQYIRENGETPPDLHSREDQNTVGECPVSNDTIAALKARVRDWTEEDQPGHILLQPSGPRICIFDGFLLYSHAMASIQPSIDIKIFLRASYAKAKARREARSGYVTLEGFWEDPEGYVDKIVWPNYVEGHRWMFENGDVEGRMLPKVLERDGVEFQEGLDVSMEDTLIWAVELLMRELPPLLKTP